MHVDVEEGEILDQDHREEKETQTCSLEESAPDKFTEKFSEHFEIPRALALAIDKELYQATGTESLYKGKIRNLLGHFVHRPDVDPREKTKIMEKLKSGDLKPLEFALLTDNDFEPSKKVERELIALRYEKDRHLDSDPTDSALLVRSTLHSRGESDSALESHNPGNIASTPLAQDQVWKPFSLEPISPCHIPLLTNPQVETPCSKVSSGISSELNHIKILAQTRCKLAVDKSLMMETPTKSLWTHYITLENLGSFPKTSARFAMKFVHGRKIPDFNPVYSGVLYFQQFLGVREISKLVHRLIDASHPEKTHSAQLSVVRFEALDEYSLPRDFLNYVKHLGDSDLLGYCRLSDEKESSKVVLIPRVSGHLKTHNRFGSNWQKRLFGEEFVLDDCLLWGFLVIHAVDFIKVFDDFQDDEGIEPIPRQSIFIIERERMQKDLCSSCPSTEDKDIPLNSPFLSLSPASRRQSCSGRSDRIHSSRHLIVGTRSRSPRHRFDPLRRDSPRRDRYSPRRNHDRSALKRSPPYFDSFLASPRRNRRDSFQTQDRFHSVRNDQDFNPHWSRDWGREERRKPQESKSPSGNEVATGLDLNYILSGTKQDNEPQVEYSWE